jgi:hypothetical protein
MLGESGWFVAVFYTIFVIAFWHFRDRSQRLPEEGARKRNVSWPALLQWYCPPPAL